MGHRTRYFARSIYLHSPMSEDGRRRDACMQPIISAVVVVVVLTKKKKIIHSSTSR